jgi:long-chain acyl-CoA synthetase
MGGASITYMSSLRPDVIFATMAERKITAMGCVPQVLTLFRRGIEMQVKAQKKERQFAKLHAIARYLPHRARRLLFKPIHAKMGGSFDFFVAGGAYLDQEVARWWERMGVRVLQGYGMTEASPIITCHSVFKRDDISVGWPLPGVELRIAEDGEIQIRGESVSQGYWNDPEATTAAFEEGWYKTGDLGSIDKDGRLFLRGRKKNMIVLANGMKVHPEDLEHILVGDARIKDAVVLGLERGQDVEVHAVLLTKEPEAVPEIIKQTNSKLAPHQQIRKHTIWPDESFPLTPTLKPKRAEIMAKLAELEPVRA